MDHKKLWPWIALGAAAPWVMYFNDGGGLWMTAVGLSGTALLSAVPKFRGPSRSNPWGLRPRVASIFSFSNGLFFGGCLCLAAGLFAGSTLTAGMGSILVWMGAVHRVYAITAERRKQAPQCAEQAREPV